VKRLIIIPFVLILALGLASPVFAGHNYLFIGTEIEGMDIDGTSTLDLECPSQDTEESMELIGIGMLMLTEEVNASTDETGDKVLEATWDGDHFENLTTYVDGIFAYQDHLVATEAIQGNYYWMGDIVVDSFIDTHSELGFAGTNLTHDPSLVNCGDVHAGAGFRGTYDLVTSEIIDLATTQTDGCQDILMGSMEVDMASGIIETGLSVSPNPHEDTQWLDVREHQEYSGLFIKFTKVYEISDNEDPCEPPPPAAPCPIPPGWP
jgi:hypothetical protein